MTRESAEDTPRARLRQALAARHDKVELLFGRLDIAKPADYREFLQRHAMAVIPAEQAVERGGVQDVLHDWQERSRRAALIADVQSLGADIPQALPVGQPADRAAMLGMAYVLEGSRLGNQFLLRQVLNAGDLASAAATRYLSHGAKNFWPSFVAALNTHGCDQADAMIAGAATVFTLFEQAATAPLT